MSKKTTTIKAPTAPESKPTPSSVSTYGVMHLELPPRADGTARDGELTAARAAGFAMLETLNNTLPGDPRDTVTLARAAAPEYRDQAWQGAGLRSTIERIVNVVLDHAINRQDQMESAETYARDLAERADQGEVATVKLTETLERLAVATEDAAVCNAFAQGVWDFWNTHCGGEFRRFDNSYPAYRRKKAADGGDSKTTSLDPVQAAMLARIKGKRA